MGMMLLMTMPLVPIFLSALALDLAPRVWVLQPAPVWPLRRAARAR